MRLWRSRRVWTASTAMLVIAVLLFGRNHLPLQQWIQDLISWSEQNGLAGKVLFTAVYTAAMVLCLWGTPFTLAAGLAFGLWWGTLIATVSATAGSTIAFLIARHGARQSIARWVQRDPRFQAIDTAIGGKGWKIVLLTRLSPIIPFSVSNYVFGVTSVGLGSFVWASLLAILPGSFLVAYLGHAGRMTLFEEDQELGFWEYLLLGGGLVFTAGIVAYLGRISSQALAKLENTGCTTELPG